MAKVMFSQASVILITLGLHSHGEGRSRTPEGRPQEGRPPLRRQTLPQEGRTPRIRILLLDTVNKQVVRILLEYILVHE